MDSSPRPYPSGAQARLPRRGRCLCAAFTLEVRLYPDRLGACHCGMCRRWGGGPLLSVDCGSDVTVLGPARLLGQYDSSPWAQRMFCKQCGTHLFYREREGGRHYVPVGLLDDVDGLRLSRQTYVDRQPPYYGQLATYTLDLTEAEMIALYAPAGTPGTTPDATSALTPRAHAFPAPAADPHGGAAKPEPAKD